MRSFKIIFFPDGFPPHLAQLKNELAHSYTCIQSANKLEYKQSYNQVGKFVVLFSDSHSAVKFLLSPPTTLNGLKFKTFVFRHHDMESTAVAQKIFNELGIEVFLQQDIKLLKQEIDTFFDKGES